VEVLGDAVPGPGGVVTPGGGPGDGGRDVGAAGDGRGEGHDQGEEERSVKAVHVLDLSVARVVRAADGRRPAERRGRGSGRPSVPGDGGGSKGEGGRSRYWRAGVVDRGTRRAPRS